jgi:hypothetical protein
MLTLLIHTRNAWNHYFTGNPSLIESNEYGTRLTLSDTNVHILKCLFRSITSTSGNGGALLCTSTTYLLIESTSFFSCKTNGQYGGAIYFYNRNSGQCVLYEVCGYDCCSTYSSDSTYDLFARMDVKDSDSSKSYVNYSSISRCINGNSNSKYVMRHHNGKICYTSVNFSMNKYYYGGIICGPYVDSNYVTCSFSYSTFADNIAVGRICIYFWSSAKHEIKSCNIIRNSQDSSQNGVIYAEGDLMIQDSCILENIAPYIFYQSSSYTITVSNCTLDKTTFYGNYKTMNIITKSFIIALNHMSTRNCNAEYDSVGTLTPFIQPSSSKQRYYCTFEIMFYHRCQQGNFVSLTSILVFNFIYPY